MLKLLGKAWVVGGELIALFVQGTLLGAFMLAVIAVLMVLAALSYAQDAAKLARA